MCLMNGLISYGTIFILLTQKTIQTPSYGTDPMKVSNIEYKLKHWVSTMVICGSYMFEFSVS